MRLVIVESPYAGDVTDNIMYGRRCMSDCFARGEAPYASHLLYTQVGVLDDNVPEDRKLGIEAGFRWAAFCDARVFYIDRGWSKGMHAGLEDAVRREQTIEFRTLDHDIRQAITLCGLNYKILNIHDMERVFRVRVVESVEHSLGAP